MSERKRFDLQFFADGGAAGGEGGGDGTAAGAEAVDAGRSRLEELGVPPGKIRDRKQKSTKPLPQGLRLAGEEPAGQVQEAAPAAQEQKPEGAEGKTQEPAKEPKRLSFDEIKADPEYNANIEALVRARLREESGAKAMLDRLASTLQKLGERAGIQIDTRDMMALDLDGVDIQLRHDPEEVKELAAQLGTSQSVAREVLDNRIKLEQEQAKSRRLNETMEEQRKAEARRQHVQRVERDLQQLKDKYPGINIDREMADPAFQRLTAPGVNVPVEQALWAIHHNDFAQQAVAAGFNEGRRRMTAALQAANDRPAESGTGAAGSGVPSFDYSRLSREEREAFKERIRQEAAAGRKIFPVR